MKIMRRSQFDGFTLIEVLIAASIFTIVSLIAVIVFVNIIRIQRRVSLENAIYEDSRVMMERIAREVRENTIDYEEYYNKASNQDTGAVFTGLFALNAKNPYGNRFGCYAQRFYNPGTGGPDVGELGAWCNDGATDASTSPDCIVDKNTQDTNTGQNPYAGYTPDTNPIHASAFCDNNHASESDPNCGLNSDTDHNIQSELYLINADGTQKTILASKVISAAGDHALALIKLTGEDDNQDGIVETWDSCTKDLSNPMCCSTGFDCIGLSLSSAPLESTLNPATFDNLYKGFIPISPTRTTIKSLKFIVAPLEDPRKAFAETSNDVQQQPHVTIVMTVQPSSTSLSGFTDTPPSVTLQTTVTSRVYNEVKSFYTTKSGGENVCGGVASY